MRDGGIRLDGRPPRYHQASVVEQLGTVASNHVDLVARRTSNGIGNAVIEAADEVGRRRGVLKSAVGAIGNNMALLLTVSDGNPRIAGADATRR